MYSPANIYFARRSEVSKFPFEIILKICNEANKELDSCSICGNYMKNLCALCGVCDHCNPVFNDIKVVKYRENDETENRVHICDKHVILQRNDNSSTDLIKPTIFCKEENCDNILMSLDYAEQKHCRFHDLKCFKCGNSFKTRAATVYHIQSYHKIMLW